MRGVVKRLAVGYRGAVRYRDKRWLGSVGGMERQDEEKREKMKKEGPVEESIRNKLDQKLSPVWLKVDNESFMHSVPKGSETHFKVGC